MEGCARRPKALAASSTVRGVATRSKACSWAANEAAKAEPPPEASARSGVALLGAPGVDAGVPTEGKGSSRGTSSRRLRSQAWLAPLRGQVSKLGASLGERGRSRGARLGLPSGAALGPRLSGAASPTAAKAAARPGAEEGISANGACSVGALSTSHSAWPERSRR